jgi:hypothetical protein
MNDLDRAIILEEDEKQIDNLSDDENELEDMFGEFK